jgi:hypothetical protein
MPLKRDTVGLTAAVLATEAIGGLRALAARPG